MKSIRSIPYTLAMLAVMGVAGFFMLDWYVNQVAFYPMRGMAVDPTDWPRPVEEVTIRTDDGVDLHAFYLPDEGSDQVLLYLHGNAGNASHRLPMATEMAELGINVLLLDYRGYGLSQGDPDEAGIYADGRAALRFLNERGYADEQIVIFGRSLGGAVSVEIAQDRNLAGVILCSTFSSGSDMASAIGLGFLAPLVRQRFNSIDKISAVRVPLLFLHGSEDRIVPHRLGQRLFEQAPEPKFWVTIPDVGHNDVVASGADIFWPTLRSFLLQNSLIENAQSS